MFKKKRIKKEFDNAIAEGNEKKANRLLSENPWLQEYANGNTNGKDQVLKKVCAAIGVMEDELNAPVPIDEVIYSLNMDFEVQLTSNELDSILIDLETKGYIKSELEGYTLTVEGGRICDNYLNEEAKKLLNNLEN
ncbi:MAG: hypothetical protein ACTSYF_14235 [Promethearchaeota archaeon]